MKARGLLRLLASVFPYQKREHLTEDAALYILKRMYKAASWGDMALTVHFFGIRYADALKGLSLAKVARKAGVPSYGVELNKMRNLGQYVRVARNPDWLTGF